MLQRFVDLLFRRRQVRAAFESCVVATGYRDHAWPGRGNRAGVMGALSARLADAQLTIEVLHLMVDGDLGMVHLRCRHAGQARADDRVEIFRIDQGRIVEHWSVAGAPAASIPA